MVEESFQAPESRRNFVGCIWRSLCWFKMLASETHWSFVLGVVVVYGLNQGLGGAIFKVSREYYMKDVQKVQPSEAQFYAGITSIPWIVKPLWGLLTDVMPVLGYRRRPYFILAGSLTITSMLLLSLHSKLPLLYALLALMGGSAGAAIADVTVDACVAQNSNAHPRLAADMQSLCAISSATGALLGYGVSGVFVHLIGPKGVFGLLSLPAGLVLLIGTFLKEIQMPALVYKEVSQRFLGASNAMWTTLKHPSIWRPSLYMYLSLALCLHIHEGMFYWYTDSPEGPSLSKEAIGYISSIGSVGSLMGALMFQYILKRQPFRELLFWTQLLYAASGMLDLLLVLRLNLKLGIPDFFFIVIDTSVSHMIGRLKWMPLLVLCSKLCPPGIEGTFFALLMSIDNAGILTASWFGGLLLHALRVTRTQFHSLWLAVFIRNVLRLAPLGLLFLVPRADLESSVLPSEEREVRSDDVELAALVKS